MKWTITWIWNNFKIVLIVQGILFIVGCLLLLQQALKVTCQICEIFSVLGDFQIQAMKEVFEFF